MGMRMQVTMLVIAVLLSTGSLSGVEGDGTRSLKSRYTIGDVMEQSRQLLELRACCGPLALARSLHVLGREEDFGSLLDRFRTKSEDGIQFTELVKVAQVHCPDVQAVRITADGLRNVPFPAILLVNQRKHCVVLEAITDGGDVLVWNPSALDTIRMTRADLSSMWDGEAILFSVPNTPSWPNVLLAAVTGVNLVLAVCLLWNWFRWNVPNSCVSECCIANGQNIPRT